MRKKTTGRVAQSFPVSLQPEDVEFVRGRVKDLRPMVSSRSNYIQQLIEMDRQYDLLGNSVASIKKRG